MTARAFTMEFHSGSIHATVTITNDDGEVPDSLVDNVVAKTNKGVVSKLIPSINRFVEHQVEHHGVKRLDETTSYSEFVVLSLLRSTLTVIITLHLYYELNREVVGAMIVGYVAPEVLEYIPTEVAQKRFSAADERHAQAMEPAPSGPLAAIMMGAQPPVGIVASHGAEDGNGALSRPGTYL